MSVQQDTSSWQPALAFLGVNGWMHRVWKDAPFGDHLWPHVHVSLYDNSTASKWTLATPRTTWESCLQLLRFCFVFQSSRYHCQHRGSHSAAISLNRMSMHRVQVWFKMSDTSVNDNASHNKTFGQLMLNLVARQQRVTQKYPTYREPPHQITPVLLVWDQDTGYLGQTSWCTYCC